MNSRRAAGLRAENPQEILSILPPSLDIPGGAWLGEAYWDDAARTLFAQSRNSYQLQYFTPDHPQAHGHPQRPGHGPSLLGRWLLQDSSEKAIAWTEISCAKGSFSQVHILFSALEPSDPLWQRSGKNSILVLVATMTLLFNPDEVFLCAIDERSATELSNWAAGDEREFLSPVLDGLFSTSGPVFARWRYTAIDCQSFSASDLGQVTLKSLHYLELRKQRREETLRRQCPTKPRRRGILARLLRPRLSGSTR